MFIRSHRHWYWLLACVWQIPWPLHIWLSQTDVSYSQAFPIYFGWHSHFIRPLGSMVQFPPLLHRLYLQNLGAVSNSSLIVIEGYQKHKTWSAKNYIVHSEYQLDRADKNIDMILKRSESKCHHSGTDYSSTSLKCRKNRHNIQLRKNN